MYAVLTSFLADAESELKHANAIDANAIFVIFISFSVLFCFVLPDLFAGKMHALVYRAWQRRIKGRDWYDFEWYVRHRVPLDFRHLSERIREFNGSDISKEMFLQQLREKLGNTDINLVKQDVLPYVDDAHELDIWSNDYFLQIADMVEFAPI